MSVEEHTIELAGSPVFFRTAPAPGIAPLFLHGIPTSSDDWLEIQAQTGGLAPDLLGFGRSGKGGQLELTPHAMASFLEQLLDRQRIERVAVVASGWSALPALLFVQRAPARVERIALLNPLAPQSSLTWPRTARLLRRPMLGELVMGSLTERMMARSLRRSAGAPGAWPDERITRVWQQFDQGTQRAVLRLLRATDEEALAEARAVLEGLRIPVLTIWGELDPWLGAVPAHASALRSLRGELLRLPDAGHWPWLERPEAARRLVAFLRAP